MSNNLVKKIQPKAVVGDIKAMVLSGEITDGAVIMRVGGIVTGVEKGESNYGEWTGLKGRFKAVNMLTGETFAASKAFPADVLTTEAEQALAKLAADGVDNPTLEVAYDVKVKKRVDVAQGYEYIYEIHSASEAEDPLDSMLSALPQAKPLALSDKTDAGESKSKAKAK